jgi:hypothetical protein
MMNLADQLERGFLIASLFATLLLALRLFSERLHRKYPCLTAYLLFQLAISTAAYFIPSNTNLYGWIYFVTAPLEWILYFMIVREVYAIMLANYKGIETWGKRALTFGMLAGMVLALITLKPDLEHARPARIYLDMLLVASRAVTTTVVFFLLLITAFVLWFPVSAVRNAIYYGIGYATYFLVKTLSVFLRNFSNQEYTQWFSVANMAVASLVFFLLAWKINNKSGEEMVNLGDGWRHGDREGLSKQLDSINDALLKAGRQ